jgi:murein DD-endopeptidase MepM/ murein hydrolase activator NlpD
MRVALVMLALLVTLALSNARRDTSPPEVFTEVAMRVAAAEPFDLSLSANEPVTYLVRYGDLALERVAQDLTVSLLALAGTNRITVEARDAAGNQSIAEYDVDGVEAVVPRLEFPGQVSAGDPFTVVARWEDTGAGLEQAALEVPAAQGTVLRGANELTLVTAAPLGSADAVWNVEATLQDEFGRTTLAVGDIRVVAGSHPIEELNVPASTLSVITPAGRVAEQEAFDRAFADTIKEPQWSEPFLLPIEGRSTSGFGLPRRYAPGGPVSYHEGSDIGAPAGTPIQATNAGVVRVADFYPIKGGLTIIDHGAGVSSLYFHQSRIDVEAGETVSRGQVIGQVGSTGLSTGPHLHWEMRVRRLPTNPMAWVGDIWP